MTSTDSLRRLLLLSVIMLASLALASAGQSAASNAAASDKVDAVFAKFTRSTPGCALGVVQDGSLVYRKGYGLASLELAVPISPETVFDIGSDSKQITAAAVILLAQQGKLSLNDDVRKFLPELPDYGKTIRISNLLHHTSGIRDYIGLLTMAGAQEESVTTDDEALGILSKQKGPETFTQFVRDGLQGGYEPALQRYYGYQSFADLEQHWLQYAFGDRLSAGASNHAP